MRNYDSMSGDMITSHSRPLKNVIGKHRKSASKIEVASTLAGKPQSVIDSINERVDIMRVRHEQGLDLWTGEPLSQNKEFL